MTKMPTDKKVEYMIHELESAIRISKKAIDDWMVRIAEYPEDAIEWGDSPAKQCVRNSLATKLLMLINDLLEDGSEKEGESVHELVLREVEKMAMQGLMRCARETHNSTSAMSNLTNQLRAEYWAGVVNRFQPRGYGSF